MLRRYFASDGLGAEIAEQKPPRCASRPTYRPAMRRRKRSSAIWQVNMRMRWRSPRNWRWATCVPAASASPTYIVPTGASCRASGPATPVIESAYVESVRRRAPMAMASAVSLLTAPYSQHLRRHAQQLHLHRVGIGDEAADEVLRTAGAGRETLAEHAAGGALRDRDGGVILAQHFADRRLPADRRCASKSGRRAASRWAPRLRPVALRPRPRVAAARAQVDLQIAVGGQDGGHRVLVLLVDRRDQLIEVDSDMPVTRKNSVRITCLGTMRERRGRHCRSNMAFNSCGGPGSSITTAPDSSTHWPGAVPRSLGRIVGAFDHERLALVDFRHFAFHGGEALLQRVGDLGVEDQLAIERLGHRFARHVVLGRPEAAGENHDLDAREARRMASARRSRSSPMTRLGDHLDAQVVQLRR